MTDDVPITLDYAVPEPGRFWPAVLRWDLRTPIAINAFCGLATCELVLQASRRHDGSFGGCATGRLHTYDMLLLAVLPACTIALAAVAPTTHGGWVRQWTRYGMLVSVAAYGVIWLDFIEALAFLKFDILRMR